MSLRARIVAYLAVLHLLFAGVSALLLRETPLWLIAVEAAYATSLVVGLVLARSLTRGLALVSDGARMIQEEEFTSRFREIGEPEVDRLVGVYNRMVDHLRDERARVQEQHHFLAQVLDASPSGVVILDFDDRISDLNPAAERILGLSRATATGAALDVVSGGLGEALRRLPRGAAAVAGLSGAMRVKLYHGTFIDRGFERSFYLVEELTEELRQFERSAYEKLIRVMSHEVNNTVAAANSLLHSSLAYGRVDGTLSRPDFEEAIGIVIGRTEQLSAFMRRFADVFRLPPPRRARTRLVEVLETVTTLVAAMPDGQRIRWRREFANAQAVADVDRAPFEQALLNITKNAAEAAGAGGAVTVRLTGTETRPLIEVEDDGPGLTPEAQANLFTPFFSTKANGQGIGLTFVQEVLTAHEVSYSLERRGSLTVFRIGW